MKTVVLDKRFRRSKRGTVMLKNGEACSLKRHFRGALRELVSRLDHFARLSDETFPRAQYKRFVFASVESIAAGCRRYQGKGYSKTMVEKALRELRSKHVISERFEAEIAPGEARVGFVVTPHAALCVQTSRACTMVGQLRAPGAWVMLENGPAIWVEELS